MIPRLFRNFKTNSSDLLASQLYNEPTFYIAFIRDLNNCQTEAIIESPFITRNRVARLLPIFEKMRSRNVKIVINTRDPAEHDEPHGNQARDAIAQMQQLGVLILFTGKHHRKLAVFDRKIFYEGSLNILSQLIAARLCGGSIRRSWRTR
jgi:phosphatidylserine/phosphatidylglycerophosphate/cardiolipin synthase-like enzyme